MSNNEPEPDLWPHQLGRRINAILIIVIALLATITLVAQLAHRFGA